MKKIWLFAALLALSGTSFLPAGAHADGYKSGDKIKVMVGYKPGGGIDRLTQLVNPFLAKAMDVVLINEYVPGAGGAIMTTKVTKFIKADGYTIAAGGTGFSLDNLTKPNIEYTRDDFEPLALVVEDAGILVVNPEKPWKTFTEFMAACKAAPGQVNVGYSDPFADDHYSWALVEKATGMKTNMVPMGGDGAVITGVLGQKIDAGSTNVGVALAHINGGKMRALAVYAKNRLPSLPDVPTLKELGFDVVNGSYRGYVARKGIPTAMRDALIAGFKKVMVDPDFLALAAKEGVTIDGRTGKDYADFMAWMETAYLPIIEEAKKAQATK